MNVHYPQVEKKSQVFSYVLAVFAAFTVLMLTLSFSRHAELHLSIPSESIQVFHTENVDLPVAIPAPMPPAEPLDQASTEDYFRSRWGYKWASLPASLEAEAEAAMDQL